MPVEDVIQPDVPGRSIQRGDVPDPVKRRYYTDDRGGEGLGFYVDARVQTAAFRDRGDRLVADRADPNAIRDMLVIAQHRRWASVAVSGSEGFRREAWLEGRSIGLEVQGYRPSERDLQELARRQSVHQQRTQDEREVRRERQGDRLDRRGDESEVGRERREDARLDRRLRVVDAVIRARLSDPRRQSEIMAAARERLADWLERGARSDPPRERAWPERRRSR